MTTGQDEDDHGSLVERAIEATAAAHGLAWADVSSLDEAAANARRLVQERVDELRQAINRMEVFNTVENLRLAATPMNPEEYRESEHEGMLAAAELAAVLFLERGRTQSEPIPFEESAEWLAKVHRLLPEALRLQSVAGALALQAEEALSHPASESSSAVGPRIAARLRHSVVTRELAVRNPAYVHLERSFIERLFMTPKLTDVLQGEIGFDATDLLAIFDALESRTTDQLIHDLRTVREEIDNEYERNEEFRTLVEEQGDNVADVLNRMAGAMVFPGLQNIASFDADQLAAESGVSVERVGAALSALSWRVDEPVSGLVEGFLSGDNPLRLRPFLESADTDGSSRWLLVHPGLLIFAVRPFLEARLTASEHSDAYLKHRAHVLERDGIGMLIRILRPELALRNVEYVTESGEVAEADGLILVDRVALVVEAKSRPLSSKSRTGHGARIRRDLSDVVSEAARQAERMTKVLSSGRLAIRSAQQMDDVGNVARVIRDEQIRFQHIALTFPIVLTLEDLNALTIVTADLVASGILAGTSWPWIVNLHDLTVMSDVISLPAEFIHYLLRRRAVSQQTAYVAHEELDLFMRYLGSGLFVDPDDPGVLNILLSHTDELDAWYAYELGWRQTPAPRPAQPMSADLRRLLDYLDERRPPSWLVASIDLLELSEDSRDEISGLVPKLASLSQEDGQRHSAAIPIRPPETDWFGFVIISTPSGTSRDELATRLRAYTQLRKYASKLKRVTGFGVIAGSSRPFDLYVQIESDWTQDEELDSLIREAGIQPDPD